MVPGHKDWALEAPWHHLVSYLKDLWEFLLTINCFWTISPHKPQLTRLVENRLSKVCTTGPNLTYQMQAIQKLWLKMH